MLYYDLSDQAHSEKYSFYTSQQSLPLKSKSLKVYLDTEMQRMNLLTEIKLLAKKS